MDSTAYLLLLGLMGTVCGSPICRNNCTFSKTYHHPQFQHVSDLKGSSVAPWDLTLNVSEGREPQVIQHAMCKVCTVKYMTAEPIFIQISVYERINHTANAWCKCPYDLAVGCTCVNKQ